MKKKLFICITSLFLICCFSGCAKETTDIDFYEFAKENLASGFYEMSDELIYITHNIDENKAYGDIETGITEYHYNLKNNLIWRTATMVKICYYSENGYETIKKTITDEWELREIAEEYEINGNESVVYYVDDVEHQYGENKDFGFVALSDEKDCIYFLWFYDQDYDVSISRYTFDEFYKSEFDWFEKK